MARAPHWGLTGSARSKPERARISQYSTPASPVFAHRHGPVAKSQYRLRRARRDQFEVDADLEPPLGCQPPHIPRDAETDHAGGWGSPHPAFHIRGAPKAKNHCPNWTGPNPGSISAGRRYRAVPRLMALFEIGRHIPLLAKTSLSRACTIGRRSASRSRRPDSGSISWYSMFKSPLPRRPAKT